MSPTLISIFIIMKLKNEIYLVVPSYVLRQKENVTFRTSSRDGTAVIRDVGDCQYYISLTFSFISSLQIVHKINISRLYLPMCIFQVWNKCTDFEEI